MGTATSVAALGFIAWALLLIIVMEVMRAWLVMAHKHPVTGFTPDNANLSPFMQRLARAHANCIEGLPIFGGLMVLALLTHNTAITDPLAYWLLAARIAQSLVHLLSVTALAINLRFTFFAVQLVISGYWVIGLWQTVEAVY